jgi:hypothetical protein
LAYTIGPVIPSGSMFRNMVFNNVQVSMLNPLAPLYSAVLNGTVTVSPGGDANGSVFVMFSDGSNAMINFIAPAMTQIQTGASVLDLETQVLYSDDQALLNGVPVSINAIMTLLQSHIQVSMPPNLMSDSERALLALGTLTRTSQWNLNVGLAQQLGPALLAININGFWCKLAVKAAVAGALALGNAFCNMFCAAGGAVTFGGLTVPCGAICLGGALLAPAVLNTVFLAAWTE